MSDTANWIDIINTLGTLASSALGAFHRSKELAEKDGVSREEIDAATARFTQNFPDPLVASETPNP